MIWGGISLTSKTPLVTLSGTLNSEQYIDEVIEPIVVSVAERYGPDFVLMDDNARPHRARIVNDYLHAEGINRMDPWPAVSPDLNPIEHLWDYLGRVVNKPLVVGDRLAQLRVYVDEEWC